MDQSAEAKKVSVVIPVYNIARYLPRCLDSVLGQTYTDLDVVLVDDGSRDESGTVCDRYAQKDPRVRAVHTENRGVSSARNTGLEMARGDYVIFADGDDWLDGEAVGTLVRLIEKDQSDIAAMDIFFIPSDDQEDQPLRAGLWKACGGKRLLEGREIYFALLCRSATLWNKLFRKKVLEGQRFDVNMTYAEDTHFLAKVLAGAFRVSLTDYAGYYYRGNRPGNVVTESLNPRHFELLKNSISIFEVLKACPDPTVGVHRINVAASGVLIRLTEQKTRGENDGLLLKECRKTARYPGWKLICRYLADGRYEKTHRLRFLLIACVPSVYMRIKKRFS